MSQEQHESKAHEKPQQVISSPDKIETAGSSQFPVSGDELAGLRAPYAPAERFDVVRKQAERLPGLIQAEERLLLAKIQVLEAMESGDLKPTDRELSGHIAELNLRGQEIQAACDPVMDFLRTFETHDAPLTTFVSALAARSAVHRLYQPYLPLIMCFSTLREAGALNDAQKRDMPDARFLETLGFNRFSSSCTDQDTSQIVRVIDALHKGDQASLFEVSASRECALDILLRSRLLPLVRGQKDWLDFDPNLARVELPTLVAIPLVEAAENLVLNAKGALRESRLLDSFTPKRRGQIYVTLSEEGGVIHLSVGDNGPGLPPSVVDRLVSPLDMDSEGMRTGLRGHGHSILRNVLQKLGAACFVRTTGDRVETTFQVGGGPDLKSTEDALLYSGAFFYLSIPRQPW